MKYLNRQKYSECQLVTAINCYTYLTGKIIKQDSKRYEKLVDLVAARYGSAISIEKAYKRLGIEVIRWYYNEYELASKRNKFPFLPLVAAVWYKRYGCHSVAIVDYEPKTDCILVPNFKYVTSMDGWVFIEDFKPFVIPISNKDKCLYRLFGKKVQRRQS